MFPRFLVLALCLSCLSIVPAVAETMDDGKGRFAMSPVEGGFLRLDKESGAVASCARTAEAWVCNPVEDHAAVQNETLAKLELENQALKNRVKNLEESLETGKPPASPDATPGPPGGKMQLPSEEEVDKALDYAERMFKKFRDRLGRLDKSTPPGDGSGRL